jgi:glycine hydroxymethyltransferase
LTGEKIRQILNYLLPIDNESLPVKTCVNTKIIINGFEQDCVFSIVDEDIYQIGFKSKIAGMAVAWLRDLSDGFVYFDEDIERRIPGPFMVMDSEPEILTQSKFSAKESSKPFYVGIDSKQKDNQESGTSFL